MNRTEEILKLAEKYRDFTAESLSELVRAKSMSGEEKTAADVLAAQMRDAGFDEVSIDPLGNVIGRIGSGGKVLAFDAHIDTVDTGNLDNWNFDPFSGEIKDGFVHGRGSVDQKGGAASFITAGKIIKELGGRDDLTIYFVGSVMEEDCDGLCWKYIIEEDGIRPNLVISTEPTNLNIYRGQRGRMEMNVSFRGISSHGSAPERGKNAIYMGSKVALEIEKLNEKLKDNDFLGKGSITISEFVSGSPSLCAVADFARIHIDRRLTVGETEEIAVAEIEKIVEGMDAEVIVPFYEGKAYTGLKYGMKKYYPTWLMPENHEMVVKGVDTYQDLFGLRPETGRWTFSTNGVTINGLYKIPVIGFGPGDEKLAHAPNEMIPVEDLVKAAAFYAEYTFKM